MDQSTEADESKDRQTPPKPNDAQLQEKNLDPDSFLNSTIKIPMTTLYNVAMGAMLLLIVVNMCGLSLLCHRQRNRAKAPPRPPTFPTMNARTSNGPDQATTWEDALSNRGLGGLGRLETPTPPPFPAPKDDLNA